MATRKRTRKTKGDSGNFGLTNAVAVSVKANSGTLAPPLKIEQPSLDAAPDYRIKSIADIDQKKLQALIEKTYQLGFTGTYTAKLETIGVPQGGSYPVATLSFRSSNGVTGDYDIGLFMAYPEITWQEMRNVHLLPTIGVNFAR